MKKSISNLMAIAAFTVSLAACCQSQASIVLLTGNNPQADEENVLLNDGETGSLVTGETNQSGVTVNFTSTVNTLLNAASGQAMVTGVPESAGINEITISVPGYTFTDLIFNAANTAQIGTAGALATVTVLVNELDGTTSTETFSYTLGQGAGVGNGFATLLASDGETMSSVTISLDEDEYFHDLEQVRISGLTGNGQIPEPAGLIVWSLLALMGMAIGWRHR
ncbi:MAG: hypothetical protein ABFC63_11660 [Thermoguttaceae bacterium]